MSGSVMAHVPSSLMYKRATAQVLSHPQVQCSPTTGDGVTTQGVMKSHEEFVDYKVIYDRV